MKLQKTTLFFLLASFVLLPACSSSAQLPLQVIQTVVDTVSTPNDDQTDQLAASLPINASPAPDSSMNGRRLGGTFEGRYYEVYLPVNYSADRPRPLVLTLHGSGMSARHFANQRDPELFEQADARGWILAFPDGTPCDHKDGLCFTAKGESSETQPDDVEYLSALIEMLQQAYAIDADSLYAMGFSNGGGMAERLGAELPTVFAAVASVAGLTVAYDGVQQSDYSITTPTGPIPVMLVRGKLDPTRTYEGREDATTGSVIGSAHDDAKFWAEANGCDLNIQRHRGQRGQVRMEGYDDCALDTEVVLVTVKEMPHTWPDAADGYGFNANKRVLQFFARHSKVRDTNSN